MLLRSSLQSLFQPRTVPGTVIGARLQSPFESLSPDVRQSYEPNSDFKGSVDYFRYNNDLKYKRLVDSLQTGMANQWAIEQGGLAGHVQESSSEQSSVNKGSVSELLHNVSPLLEEDHDYREELAELFSVNHEGTEDENRLTEYIRALHEDDPKKFISFGEKQRVVEAIESYLAENYPDLVNSKDHKNFVTSLVLKQIQFFKAFGNVSESQALKLSIVSVLWTFDKVLKLNNGFEKHLVKNLPIVYKKPFKFIFKTPFSQIAGQEFVSFFFVSVAVQALAISLASHLGVHTNIESADPLSFMRGAEIFKGALISSTIALGLNGWADLLANYGLQKPAEVVFGKEYFDLPLEERWKRYFELDEKQDIIYKEGKPVLKEGYSKVGILARSYLYGALMDGPKVSEVLYPKWSSIPFAIELSTDIGLYMMFYVMSKKGSSEEDHSPVGELFNLIGSTSFSDFQHALYNSSVSDVVNFLNTHEAVPFGLAAIFSAVAYSVIAPIIGKKYNVKDATIYRQWFSVIKHPIVMLAGSGIFGGVEALGINVAVHGMLYAWAKWGMSGDEKITKHTHQ